MKFIKQPDGLLCKLNNGESQALMTVFSHYPARKIGKPRLSKQKGFKEDNELLKTALEQSQKANESIIHLIQKQLADNLDHPRFKLSFEQVEILLQILNDLRVGFWEKLGSPSLDNLREAELGPREAAIFGIIEVAGYIQAAILHAREK